MSSGGGSQTTTQRTEPYSPAEPFLKDILGEAQQLYRSGTGRQFFPGSTVVPFAQQTEEALKLQQAAALEQAKPSALMGQSAGTFGQFARQPMSAYTGRMGTGFGSSMPGMTTQGLGTSYGQLTPQADYLSDVRSGITSDVMGSIQSQFGGIASQMAQTERGREQQALESQLGRLYGGGQADLQRQQSALESQFGRQYGASQADIARQQQGMESAFGRQLAGAGALPGLQQQMDMRRQQAIGQLGGVGTAYENLAQRQLQDQIARFQFGQQVPMQQLQQYAGLISPIAAGYPTAVATGPGTQSGGLSGAFGGAVAGSALGSPGAIGGALLGGLGFL